jgi:serine/threonine protein kinase/tetratricopeptide (TPR) repeat protein
MNLSAGTMLGPYEIISLLGVGGMGEVWKARDTRLGRLVAIKQLMREHSDRFEHEAHAIASLNHPNICQIHDVGPDYLVLEFLEGHPLRGPVPPAEAVGLAMQIVSALEEAHGKGILHRDLKPANVMVVRRGGVSDSPASSIAKLLDFGLAKPFSTERDATRTAAGTAAGSVVGTAAYMSPEQAEGKSLDARSDIFSFGAVLYELLSGQRPFDGTSTIAVLSSVLRDDPPPIEAPPALEQIVRRCLQKPPGQRFQTMTDVRLALEHAASPRVSTGSDGQPSIAVLPFANMSSDKDNDYFSDGLTEELINALAHLPGLKVAGRTSSFSFRGKDVEFGVIGKKLNVEHVLEGSVRKAGNRVRVTAQLIKVADGFHLWSERYDRELTDIFAMQDEITQAIATALQMKLAPKTAAARPYTPNLRAYEAYLKSRDYFFKPSPDALARVKESVEHAIELDPKFALAYSMLGIYYTMLANLGNRPAREVIPMARAAELEALRVDPALPEAHAILGVCDGIEYEWNEAERRWRLAMSREPISRDIRFWYGNHYLLPLGRIDEAVEAMTWGLELDPLNLLYRHHLAVGFRHAGRFENAEAELRKVLEIDENFALALETLGAICAQQGRFDEALALTERAYAFTPWASPTVGQLAALLVRAGDTKRADAILDKLRRGEVCGPATGLALFHAMCGEFDRAAESAVQAVEERHPLLIRTLRPLLHSSSEWPALARMMKIH